MRSKRDEQHKLIVRRPNECIRSDLRCQEGCQSSRAGFFGFGFCLSAWKCSKLGYEQGIFIYMQVAGNW